MRRLEGTQIRTCGITLLLGSVALPLLASQGAFADSANAQAPLLASASARTSNAPLVPRRHGHPGRGREELVFTSEDGGARPRASSGADALEAGRDVVDAVARVACGPAAVDDALARRAAIAEHRAERGPPNTRLGAA